MSGPSPPLLQINQIHHATGWEGGVVRYIRRIDDQEYYVVLDIIKQTKTEKTQARPSSRSFTSKLLWPNIMCINYTTCFRTTTSRRITHSSQIAVSGDIFLQESDKKNERAGTSNAVLTPWCGCPLFWPSWLCTPTMGKRQTVNYFVHINHVPQLRQEHLVTVPEITEPQWQPRKARQMEGQRKKSRAASHPLQ